jgi:hypothetical protein
VAERANIRDKPMSSFFNDSFLIYYYVLSITYFVFRISYYQATDYSTERPY